MIDTGYRETDTGSIYVTVSVFGHDGGKWAPAVAIGAAEAGSHITTARLLPEQARAFAASIIEKAALAEKLA